MSKNKGKQFQEQAQRVSQLIAEQKSSIPMYKQRWMDAALSCEEIDPQKASAAIKLAYEVMDKSPPEIYFCDSPVAALDILFTQLWRLQKSSSLVYHLEHYLWQALNRKVSQLLWSHLEDDSTRVGGEIQQLKVELGCGQTEWQKRRASIEQDIFSDLDLIEAEYFEEQLLWNELLWSDSLLDYLNKHFEQTLIDYGFAECGIMWDTNNKQHSLVTPKDTQSRYLQEIYDSPFNREIWAYYACWLDFCGSVFDFIDLGEQWDALQAIVQYCGWIYPLEELCLVCDRPRSISLDLNGTRPCYVLTFKDLPQISLAKNYA